MPAGLPNRVRFGAFEFNLRAGEVRKGRRKVLLPEQSFQILLMLVERRGELVTREEIKKKLWPNDTVVEFDHSIANAIRKLRRVLGDSAENPKYIETVARRGYRLLALVEWEDDSPDATPNLSQKAAEKGRAPSDPVVPNASDGSIGSVAAIEFAGPPVSDFAGKKVAQYRVLEIVGGGGMGVVYRAEDLKLGRQVAIKFLPAEVASDRIALDRFEREGRAASALEHPNICPIYQFGEHDGQPFLVMPLLEGETLRERLARSALTNEEVLNFGIQFVGGLEAAHQKGIIHRDIKPANIFITNRGEAKILDFGLAKLLESERELELAAAAGEHKAVSRDGAMALGLTRTGAALGTASYMSPEQVRGEKLDARSDLFSFGLVLYEMATGQQAFTGDTAELVHEAILHQEPLSARDLNSKVSPKLAAVISRCLDKDRERRYQHAAEVSAELGTLRKPSASGVRVVSLLALVLLPLITALVWWVGRKQPPILPEPKLTQLTANSTDNPIDSISLSPDGEYLAYKDLNGFHLKLLKTGEVRDVPPPVGVRRWAWNPGPWFPDSKALLISGSSDTGLHPSIWRFSLSEAAPHKIAEGAEAWAISPEGSLIAATANPGKVGDREIWLMDAVGRHQQWLEADEDSKVGRVMWFPNGERILYGRKNQDAENYRGFIESRAVSGGSSNTILSSDSSWADGELRDHYLLPDARLVYLVGRVGVNGPACNYWVMQLDPQTGQPAGKPRQLTNWAGVCMDFTGGTADGKKLVFTKWSSEGSLYVANVSKGGQTVDSASRLTLNDAVELPVGWTTDGKSVFYLSNVNRRLQIFSKALHENKAETVVTLANTPGGLLGDKIIPAITPDGTSLLYPVFPGTGDTLAATKLMRMPLAGGAPEVLFSAPLYDAPRCTRLPANFCAFAELRPDGKQLIFISLDPLHGRGRELARLDVEANANNGSGDEYPGNAFAWDLSADGALIAVFKKRENRIHILSTRDPSKRDITVKGWNVEELHWAPDGTGFFAASRGEDSSVLLHADLKGNTHTVWQQKGWEGLRCVPSPDGRHMAILALRLNNNAWMMENF